MDSAILPLVGALLGLVILSIRRPRSGLEVGEFNCRMDEQGVWVVGNSIQERRGWNMYQRAYFDKDNLYLMLNRFAAEVIPLETIPNRPQILDLLWRRGLLRPGDDRLRVRAAMNWRRKPRRA